LTKNKKEKYYIYLYEGEFERFIIGMTEQVRTSITKGYFGQYFCDDLLDGGTSKSYVAGFLRKVIKRGNRL
jgi:hypothetical protein